MKLGKSITENGKSRMNKYSENAKSCKALVVMYINKLILLPFS